MVYATTGSVRCFECGDIGHKRLACPHKRTGAESAAGVDASDNIEDLAEAVRDDVVPTVEVSVVNDDAVVSAESLFLQCDVCADGNVTVNLEPGVSANTIVSDVKTDDAVPSTSANKKSEGVKDASQGECYDVINEEMEEVLSDDPQLLEDSQCDDGNSQGTVLSSVRADFSGGFNKDSLYSLEEINSFLDETYGKQVNIKELFPDVDKFVESVTFYQRNVGLDQLSEKKRFRLRKHLTTIRKCKEMDRKRRKPKIVYCDTFNITIYNASHGVFSLLFSLLFPNLNFSVCMETLRIGSLNINGGRDSSKRALVKETVEQKKFNVVFLQETHSDVANETEGNLWWKGHKILSHGTNLSRGVAILFSSSLDVIIVKVEEPGTGPSNFT